MNTFMEEKWPLLRSHVYRRQFSLSSKGSLFRMRKSLFQCGRRGKPSSQWPTRWFLQAWGGAPKACQVSGATRVLRQLAAGGLASSSSHNWEEDRMEEWAHCCRKLSFSVTSSPGEMRGGITGFLSGGAPGFPKDRWGGAEGQGS